MILHNMSIYFLQIYLFKSFRLYKIIIKWFLIVNHYFVKIDRMSFVNRKIKIFKSVPKENIYFKEEYLEFNNIPEDTESGIINIYPDIRYQEVL